MKTNNKKKVKKQKPKKRPIVKNKKERILVIAQEFKFAKLLSSNEKKTRDRVLKALKKWLLNCFDKKYEFKEDDFFRVWKGLFYAVWMSDKPLIQEELCDNISGILDLFPPEQIKNAVLMTKAGLKMLATGWYGIDQHRMDKFLMLVRRYLRGSLRCLLRCNWSLESCSVYTEMLTAADSILAFKTPSYARNAVSMILHFIDCFLEELAKVSEGKIPAESMVCLLRPFCGLVCGSEEPAVVGAARALLTALLRQTDLGLQYTHAERVWQRMGCPPGGPEALEMVIEEGDDADEEDDAEDDETPKALDPRAGRVNVELPLLPVPCALLADDMRRLADAVCRTPKAYKRAKTCIERFVKLSNNVYPLRVRDPDLLADVEEDPLPRPEDAANELKDLEKKLVTSSDELALRGLSRKHRKRLLAKSRAGLSIVEDVAKPVEIPVESTNGDWNIEETKCDDKQKKPNETKNKKNQSANKKTPNKKRKCEEQENKVENVKKAKSEKKELTKPSVTKKAATKLNGDIKSKQKLKKDNNKKEETDKEKEKSKDHNQVNQALKKKDNLVSKGNISNNLKSTAKSERNIAETQTVSKAKQASKPSAKHVKATLVVKKVNNNKNKVSPKGAKVNAKLSLNTPKKVKFALKNNGAQAPVDYYKSVKQSPNIPFDSSKQPTKTNLKPSTPSPINPFFKKKLRLGRA